jgi:hypothetical protein
MIIDLTSKCVVERFGYPNENWAGDGWAIVPEALHEKARALSPFCELVFGGDGELTDLVDDGTRAAAPEPEADEVTQLQLAVAELYELLAGGV